MVDITEPTDPLADERKALLRSWFYTPGAFILTETVMTEVAAIRNIERREFHKDFVRPLFLNYRVRDVSAVQTRTSRLEALHPKVADCRILAEAEEVGLDYVLTYDRDFRRRLGAASSTTKLVTPTEYWIYLNIPRGATPSTIPHHTNPLSEQTWWKW